MAKDAFRKGARQIIKHYASNIPVEVVLYKVVKILLRQECEN